MACEGTTIFSTGAGKVVAVEQVAIPIVFSIDGAADTLNILKAICTTIGFTAQSGVQFMSSLREYIYIYVFSEKPHALTVSGLAFPASCDGTFDESNTEIPCGSSGSIISVDGPSRVIEWYECNRVTTRAESIVISLGASVAWQGFLTGMQLSIPDASTNIGQFTYNFTLIPNTDENDEMCFPLDFDCLDDNPCGPA